MKGILGYTVIKPPALHREVYNWQNTENALERSEVIVAKPCS